MWVVEYTDEFGEWWKELAESQRDNITADRLYDEHIKLINKEGLVK